ncbi:hypothetical protein A3D03_01410 [Candidatus Gottesmanbacteria bacterium RIFCSPHIGHO2_02_FULL_40_13]|uniref:DUF7847 domain-containing protein n=1 Tax=Candidatus Gottesmanbacteria bacterium RIFCSPHIGHO2_02_FULL_40_13 TaxID=1798384 RepID=A0A1F6AB21_9BACT|nr:MAG: hypothetical protein A3D03_01410 [Candidatus Gottesmanbacteria bacterium RIFCSPHIGHO2_02_FULL_40_13]
MENNEKLSLTDKPAKPSDLIAGLPPIKKLFSDAWKTFTLSLLNLFILSLVSIVGNVSALLVFGILYIILSLGSGLVKNIIQQPSALSNLPPSHLFFFIGLAGVFGILFILVNYIFRIAMVVTVARSEKQISIKENIKFSLKRVLPLVMTDFIILFFVIGGSLLFIFPALIFYFFFLFVNYEVILNNQSFLNALKKSVLLVSRRFGEILIRILILVGITILLTILIPNMIRKIDPDTYLLIALWSVLLNVLFGWFSLAFMLELYKQAQKGIENDKLPSLSIFWIVAILGWILALVLFILGIKIASLPSAQKFFQKQFTPTPTIYMRRKLPPFYDPIISPTTESPFL